MSRTVVITDCDHGTTEPEADVLRGHDVELRQATCRTAQNVIEQAGDADVLITQYAPVTAEVLQALPSCRLVVRYGVGVDSVDVPAATEHGVWVANVPDYGTHEVAEHALALALTQLRGIPALHRSVRQGGWEYRVAGPLRRFSELTFGVLGCGLIGSAVASRAAALGFRTIATDLVPRPDDGQGPDRVELDQLLVQSDVLSLHASLDDGSRHIIGAQALQAMRPTAFLVNTARGGLVDSRALLDALDDEQIAGAALDVLESEPPDETGRALARHPRVVVTPHTAWFSQESFFALKQEVAREALRVLDGDAPRSPVNVVTEGRS